MSDKNNSGLEVVGWLVGDTELESPEFQESKPNRPRNVMHALVRLSDAEAALAAKRAPSCASCNDSGIVGSAPDNYFNCPDCHRPDAAAPRPLTAEEHAVLRGAVMDGAEIVHRGKEAP